MSITTEQAIQSLTAAVARIGERLDDLITRFDTQHVETQEAIRHALADTMALGSWLREQPADNPPPDAGIMDAAAIEAKGSRAGSVLLAPSAPVKKLTKVAYFVDSWTKDEAFRAAYTDAKAAMVVPKRTPKDTNDTYLVKEAKAVYKCLTPAEEASYKIVYASYTTKA